LKPISNIRAFILNIVCITFFIGMWFDNTTPVVHYRQYGITGQTTSWTFHLKKNVASI
jgi:hypothetical protein